MTTSILYDSRVGCISVVTEMSIENYLKFVDSAYSQKGGIAGQRSVLKTTSARRIRDRMVSDMVSGAVFPPVVLGLIIENQKLQDLMKPNNEQNVLTEIDSVDKKFISIIDGMQRTTAMLDAVQKNREILSKSIRVEFWISDNQESLIYRMLVLNAGQIPWDVKHQIAVVFDSLIDAVRENTSVGRVLQQTGERRFNAGEYRAADIAEMYVAFGSRKINVDTQEYLADEFSKIDIVDAISDKDYSHYFYQCFNMLIDFDNVFAKFKKETDEKTASGRRIFDKQTARIGFIVALSVQIFGRAGADRSQEIKANHFKVMQSNADEFLQKINAMSLTALGDFLRIDVLDELLLKKVSQVGRFERNLFFEAFRVLIEENFDVNNMEQCWRASL